MEKFLKFLPLLFIIFALGAALILVRQQQETRKEAAGVDVTAGLHGALTNNNQNLPVRMTINFGNERLVAFAIKFKFTPKTLDLNSIRLHSNFVGLDPELQTNRVLKKQIDSNQGWAEIVAISSSGITGNLGLDNPLINLNFEIVGEGEARVWVDETYNHYQFARQGGDHLLNLSGDLEVSQTITGPTATPTNTPVPTNTPTNTQPPAASPTGVEECPRFNQGDANCNGRVGIVDYVIWWSSYQKDNRADFNNDGTTDLLDYVIWWKNYGS